MGFIESYLAHLVVFTFGLCAGSFLNVAIWRLPRKESISFPPSHCPECMAPIKYHDNIPLIGFAILRGKCRSCGSGISPLYPIVEFITGAMFLALFLLRGPTIFFLSDAFLGSLLLAAFFIDLRHMIIPDRLNLAGGIAGIGFAIAHGPAGLLRASAGAFTGVLIITLMALLGKLLFRRESMGMGDLKLVAVTGLFLGPLGNFAALMIAVFIGGTWGIFYLASRKGVAGAEVPFGPFIALGCMTVMFFPEHIFKALSLFLNHSMHVY